MWKDEALKEEPRFAELGRVRWQPPKAWQVSGGLLGQLCWADQQGIRAEATITHVARALAHFEALDYMIDTSELSNYIKRCINGKLQGPPFSDRDSSKALHRYIAAAVPVAQALRDHGRQLQLSLRETAAEPDVALPTEAMQREAAAAREKQVRQLQQRNSQLRGEVNALQQINVKDVRAAERKKAEAREETRLRRVKAKADEQVKAAMASAAAREVQADKRARVAVADELENERRLKCDAHAAKRRALKEVEPLKAQLQTVQKQSRKRLLRLNEAEAEASRGIRASSSGFPCYV